MADQKDSGRNKPMWIFTTVFLVALLGGGGVSAWYIFGQQNTDSPAIIDAKPLAVPQLKESAEIGPMVDIDEFIVNIISGDAAHYVKASLTVELTNDNAKTEVESRMPQMRDAVLMLISNKTYEELQDLQGKKQLKAELKSNINAILQTGKVKSIFFTNFVVQ